VLVFRERGKPEYPEKNRSEQGREPTTNSTHIRRRRQDSNPGHIGGRRVLSPLRHLCSPSWLIRSDPPLLLSFHSPDLLLPVICINNGKFSLVGVVIISGKTSSKTTLTSLLAQEKHKDSVSWWMYLVTVVNTWTEIAHAHEFGVLTVSLRSRRLEVLNGRQKERNSQGPHLARACSFLRPLIPIACYAG